MRGLNMRGLNTQHGHLLKDGVQNALKLGALQGAHRASQFAFQV